MVADGVRVASHSRSFDRSQTLYDWQHYISLVQRKPGGLRNGAPFENMGAARFPAHRDLSAFEFEQASVDEALVRNFPHPGLGCGPYLWQHAGQALIGNLR